MIQARLIGSEQLLLRLNSIPTRLRENLRVAVNRGNIVLVRAVKLKLSGPVLKNRTGRLRRSINPRLSETPTSVTGQVGTNVVYAHAHEYGFDGMVSVKEHLRTVRQAWGRPIAPVQAVVHAHEVHMHVPERSFLRSALAENTPTLRQLLRDAVMKSVE